jgi:hypothetical protein
VRVTDEAGYERTRREPICLTALPDTWRKTRKQYSRGAIQTASRELRD